MNIIKLALMALGTILASSNAYAKDTPILFYKSSGSPLSESVLEHLKTSPMKGPLVLRDVADPESMKLLRKIGNTKCGFTGGILGGFPMLFDGKTCHTSDVGVIAFLNGSGAK